MYLSEKIKTLKRLSIALAEQAKVVSRMAWNEDATVYDVEKGKQLLNTYYALNNKISELRNALGL